MKAQRDRVIVSGDLVGEMVQCRGGDGGTVFLDEVARLREPKGIRAAADKALHAGHDLGAQDGVAFTDCHQL